MVPWVVTNEGPPVEEVCRRFGLNERELADDLQLLYLCGLWPYSPDMLIEADIADGRVWIRYAEYFSRPLRLTAAEALGLLAAGAALLAVPGADPHGPLARGLEKIAGVLGVAPGEAVEVELGPAEPALLDQLRQAVADCRQVEIDYYAHGRDARATRVIDPWIVYSNAGQWYVLAWCGSSEGERSFRLDRIRSAVVLETTFAPPKRRAAPALYSPRPEDPLIELELAPSARWVSEQYPMERVEEADGGRLRVAFRASERAWLERLLLSLGPDAEVTAGEVGVAADAARRLLRRYGEGAPVS